MQQLTKQIKNAEARFAVLEEQVKQNLKDHEIIIERIEHNCELSQNRFDTIENKIDRFVTWVAIFGVTTLVGLFIFLLKNHLI